MRILVTGGTGFVGSHAVAALVEQGYDVRLLVRSPDRIAPALEPLGVNGAVGHVVGDVTDRASVERAVAGCDAVVNAANVYDLDARAYRATKDVKVRGTEVVLRAAAERGCDPIVHVSSTLTVLSWHATVGPDAPLSSARGVYTRSKVAGDRIARDLQASGLPVVLVQPGGVLGPSDPHLSDQMRRLRDVLRGLYPLYPRGGYHVCDVRDVARVLSAVVVPGRGPRRYAVPGHHVDGRRMFDMLRTVTGRRLPHVLLPAAALLAPTWLASSVQRILPFHVPAEYEGVLVTWYDTRIDDSRAREEFGIEPRLLGETFLDAVSWLRDAGHITARQAGRISTGEPI
ncbi:SDR family NAD(P)-dependent oxidoreductase [Phytoactinopolyspora halotolerans]|uniref:SDR family NAD(P)-dependent oxidoreductase n=1 Tax=Phytoactinopolyspora halotolerans TaxID=1981512 RepID=A0A6L9SEN8_9ACTN|nr:SDR family NAD(P)-dependent oxidoreductase [Phytoactinopolyspora halotolerans]NEE03114.1 SDR family NAD(P)-dependent oxidoreductase [Phytoactinopolyspora halotolerans]